MSNVHVVIDKGNAPKSVIVEGLNDVLKDGDILALPWYGIKPVPSGLAEVYEYVLDNEVQFLLFHVSGSVPPKVFQNTDHGEIQEVGNVNTQLIKSVEGKGKVLFMWDSEDEEGSSKLAERVFDNVPEKVKIVELTNGLAPISFGEDEPAPKAEVEEEDPTDDGPKPFTFDELSNMPVASLKKMAKNNGLPDGVTGKANYIKVILGEELPDFAYPPDKDGSPKGKEEAKAEADEQAEVKKAAVTIGDSDPTLPKPEGWKPAVGAEAKEQLRKSLLNQKPSDEQVAAIEAFREVAIALGDHIIDNVPVGRNRSLAITALEDTVMRGVKGILLD